MKTHLSHRFYTSAIGDPHLGTRDPLLNTNIAFPVIPENDLFFFDLLIKRNIKYYSCLFTVLLLLL